MCDDESRLAATLSKLDDNAWEQFCRTYSGPLLSFVHLRFNCSDELAEEIVQMAFIRCVRSIGTYDSRRGHLFDWLKAIARNEGCTLLRKAATHEQAELDPQDHEWLERIDEQALPDERLCREETRSFILDTIMELSSRYRQVLVMKYLQNQPVAEMARALGQSEKAVESLLTRSRVAFKELLGKRSRSSAVEGELRL